MPLTHDQRLTRDVALKVPPAQFTSDPERLTRFQREAEVLATLNQYVVSVLDGSGTDLWAYEFERGTRLGLTTNGRSRRTVWTPDGSRLAFYSTPDANGDQDLFGVPAGGGEMARLLERPRAQFPSSWSPDGRFLLFEEFEASSLRRDVMVLPIGETTKPLVVTTGRRARCRVLTRRSLGGHCERRVRTSGSLCPALPRARAQGDGVVERRDPADVVA